MSEPAIVRNPDGSLTFHRIPRSLSEAVDHITRQLHVMAERSHQ